MSQLEQNATDRPPLRWSIGTLLMCAVNLPLVVVLAVLLPLDYRRAMEEAIAVKHASLEEESMAIHQSLSHLVQNRRQETVQRYIDAICARKQETRSPGHHIAVLWSDSVLQARSHHRATPEILRAMQHAASSTDHRAAAGNETLVVGTFAGDGMEVYVSEYTSDIRRAIQNEILLHLVWLAGLAVIAAGIVNVVLLRIVTHPVKQLLSTVSRIAQGDYDLKTNSFHCREMSELSIAIQQMSRTLAANQRERRAQMERARRIQEHLLPNGVAVPDLALAHFFQPADEVAGDYYDLILLPDNTWLICVADVTGHGVAAAMGSAMLKSLILHAAEHSVEPSDVLQFINHRLPGLLPDEFVTMFLARWNPGNHRLDYASAGHEPGLLLSPGGEVRELLATGLPLGIDRAACWNTEAINLSRDDRLLLTTDGVAEASDPSDELFGRKRLSEILCSSAALPASETVESIQNAVLDHQGASKRGDDVTILLVDVVDLPASRVETNQESEPEVQPRMKQHSYMNKEIAND